MHLAVRASVHFHRAQADCHCLHHSILSKPPPGAILQY